MPASSMPPLPFLGPWDQVPLPCPPSFHCRLTGVWSMPQSWPLSPKNDTGLPEDKQIFLSLGHWGQPGVTHTLEHG